jgi:predicted nucleic acid-binding protein
VIIVSNTGPLIGLAKIQQLGLLARLAAEVYIPPQVRLELLARTGPETALIATALKEAIQVKAPGLWAKRSLRQQLPRRRGEDKR